MTNESELPDIPKLSVLVEFLAAKQEQLEAHLKRATAIATGGVAPEAHLVAACVRRALDNMQGMVLMVDTRNIFCGMPILRFQIDTAMCLYGRNLVTDIEDYCLHIVQGKKISDYKGRDGANLRDYFLHQQLTLHHPEVSTLYKEASGFVHFSNEHFRRVVDRDHFVTTEQVRLRDPESLVVGWPNEELRGALTCFVYVTDIIVQECEKWEKDQPITPPG